jgi:hypothetical protein
LNAISNVSERMAKTVKLLDRALDVLATPAVVGATICAVVLFAAAVFGVTHVGQEPEAGDITVLPAQPF